MKYKFLLSALIASAFVFLPGCNNIIEHSVSDYFMYEEGNWWQFLSNGDTVMVEIEPPDTLLQRSCFIIGYNGDFMYLTEEDESIDEYIKIIYNFSGNDYTIIEDFIMRIELPLIDGNTYQDSLVDSLNISGQWITAKCRTSGSVTSETYVDSLYTGDVYKIQISKVEIVVTPDTSMTDSTALEEYYAPNIGLVRFVNDAGDYKLIQYNSQ